MRQHYTFLFSLFFVVFVSLHTPAKAQAVDTKDSLALVNLFKSTNGKGWNHKKNWLTSPVSTWYGVTLTGNRVTKIILAYNNLSGILPATIVNLDHLQYLDLSNNSLSGSIPADIDKLSDLREVYLSSNQLTGSIPASISKMANLQRLYLDFNQLTGNIPNDIGNCTQLTQLQLESNELTGIIPASVNKLTNLLGLYLNFNQLSGTIPNLGNQPALLNLYLDHNQLTGEIPYSFGNLKNLVIVNLSYNQLKQSSDLNFPMADPKKFGYGNISFNHNNFDGLEFIANKFPQVIYAPQAIIPLHQHGNTLNVNVGGTLSNNTYSWYKVGTKGSITIKKDSTFTPTANGRYYVKVTNAIATKLTLVSDTIKFTMCNLIASSKMTNTLNMEAARRGFQVFPNPASNMITVKTNGVANIIVTNAAGTIILRKDITNNSSINVSAFPNGVYFVQNKTTQEVQRILVQH